MPSPRPARSSCGRAGSGTRSSPARARGSGSASASTTGCDRRRSPDRATAASPAGRSAALPRQELDPGRLDPRLQPRPSSTARWSTSPCPAIGADLQAEASGLQWIVNAYLLPLSALLLLGGAAGDKFGRRRLFLLGIALFALASALCALAPALELLLAGRALQGIASAMLMPNSLALLGAAFAGEARGRAIGTWAAAGAIAGALGPLLGGWLVEMRRLALHLPHQPAARRRRPVARLALRRREPGGRRSAARLRSELPSPRSAWAR